MKQKWLLSEKIYLPTYQALSEIDLLDCLLKKYSISIVWSGIHILVNFTKLKIYQIIYQKFLKFFDDETYLNLSLFSFSENMIIKLFVGLIIFFKS